ncbi:MAG: M28 family peptidase [Alphaproteobacteria bacterium]
MRPRAFRLIAFLGAASCAAALTWIALSAAPAAQTTTAPSATNWDSARAMADIARQVTFGPRSPGMRGHDRAIAMIQAEFQRLGAPVIAQTWTEATPEGPKNYTNLIARFNPEARTRVIVGTHYDSIIRAYADAHTPNGYMPGANNSASGVALLLETARAIHGSPRQPNVGVDFIFFDGEEGPVSLGAGDPAWRAVGSPHFTEHLGEFYPNGLPKSAVIFDMVCYRDLRLPPELNSMVRAPDAMHAFWNIGMGIAPDIFGARGRPIAISDDHDALNAAGIPSFLVIGFQYDPWFNTTQDTLDKCSTGSLQAVGDTLMGYLYSL